MTPWPLPERTGWFDAHVRSGRHPERPFGRGDAAAIRDHLTRFGFAGALVGSNLSWLHDPLTGNAEASAIAAELADHGVLACWTAVPATPGELADPAVLVDRAAAEGVAAFRLFPDTHRFTLTDPSLDGFFDALVRHRLPLWLDLAEAGWAAVDTLLTRHSALIIVVSQAGYRELRYAAPLLARHPGLRLDLVNLATHQALEWLHHNGFGDRLIFGSGYGLRDPAEAVLRLSAAGLDPETIMTIGRSNAEQLWPHRSLSLSKGDPDPALPFDRLRERSSVDVVDAHAHLGPYSRFFIPAPDADTMVSVMDRVGTSVTVLSSNLAIQLDADRGNDATLAAVDAHPDRLAGYAVINPWQQPDDQLARVESDRRFVGIKLHPSLHAYPVTGRRYAAVWEFADRTGCPVLSHTAQGSPWDAPAAFDTVASAYPKAKIILGHSGITPAGVDESIMVAGRHPGLHLELCGSQLVGELIMDLLAAVGPDRVLFGSDFPFIDHRLSLGRVLGLPAPDDVKRAVLGGSARRLFSWRPLPGSGG
ncbi:amidohydrolase family protein [Microlunatus parietis]|uniref:Putative TIM-barrel fold metal-dependent hydrolase n=1 Tax=Microlunatus parietis TaxID=682979 RepID=A0A7Y9I469_9ACTN|nr:amidohydrolase family protein [Microlunatus parietis]NYE69711.1 putative TIM-barrel fold metal-dependent hydrolase [Microlunatus parietis]